MDAGRCNSCRTPILWAKTAKGKAQPLDPRPEKRIVRAILPSPAIKMEKRIAVSYDAATGEHRAVVIDTWPLDAGVVGDELEVYMPHHATCPDGPSWQRK